MLTGGGHVSSHNVILVQSWNVQSKKVPPVGAPGGQGPFRGFASSAKTLHLGTCNLAN